MNRRALLSRLPLLAALPWVARWLGAETHAPRRRSEIRREPMQLLRVPHPIGAAQAEKLCVGLEAAGLDPWRVFIVSASGTDALQRAELRSIAGAVGLEDLRRDSRPVGDAEDAI